MTPKFWSIDLSDPIAVSEVINNISLDVVPKEMKAKVECVHGILEIQDQAGAATWDKNRLVEWRFDGNIFAIPWVSNDDELIDVTFTTAEIAAILEQSS
jgi:hypothetical protein